MLVFLLAHYSVDLLVRLHVRVSERFVFKLLHVFLFHEIKESARLRVLNCRRVGLQIFEELQHVHLERGVEAMETEQHRVHLVMGGTVQLSHVGHVVELAQFSLHHLVLQPQEDLSFN